MTANTTTTATTITSLEREVERFTSRLRRDVERGDYSPFSREASWEAEVARDEFEAASRAASGASYFWEVNGETKEQTLSALIADRAERYALRARLRFRHLAAGGGQNRFHIGGRQRLDVALARIYRSLQ